MAYSLTSQIPTHMLRAYDIRGDVSELTADVIYSLGLSLGSEVIKQDETKIISYPNLNFLSSFRI